MVYEILKKYVEIIKWEELLVKLTFFVKKKYLADFGQLFVLYEKNTMFWM